jgi:hypothetical protein
MRVEAPRGHLLLKLLSPEHNPVELIIVFEAHAVKEIFENLAQLAIVRPVFKSDVSDCLHILFKLHRQITGCAKLLNGVL